MKKLLIGLILVALALCLLITGCNDKTSIAENEQDEGEQFADAFIDYALEVLLADDIATDRLNKVAELLQQENGINMVEFRKRCYLITFVHAFTLQYIDSKPQYEILFPFLYDKDEPPSLGWDMPEFYADPEAAEARYWSYLDDYIFYHRLVLEEAIEMIGPPEDYNP